MLLIGLLSLIADKYRVLAVKYINIPSGQRDNCGIYVKLKTRNMAVLKGKKRVEIHLPDDKGFRDAFDKLLESSNRAEKNYIETIIIEHVKTVGGWVLPEKKP